MCRPPENQGVAVYFTYNGSEQCIPCDKWRTIRENMRAIADHRGPAWAGPLGSQRGGECRVLRVQGAAPSDDAALVSGQLTWHGREDWWEVLGVSENAPDGSCPRRLPSRDLATVVSRRSFERIKQAYDAGMAAR